MDMDAIVREATRWACRARAARLPQVSEIKRLLMALNVGVLDVVATPDAAGVRLKVVLDDGWESLDERWTSADSMAAMFNALETGGFRHVPGTSGFDGESTVFVKDGLEFDFARPPFEG